MSENQPCSGAPVRRARLRVLGTFELRLEVGAEPGADLGADQAPLLTTDERRLLAALAVTPTPRTARELTLLLWPELPADTALGTLAGVRDALAELITGTGSTLRLADRVEVDLTHALSCLRGWQRDPHGVPSQELDELVELLGRDVLPGWTEGWVNQERARFHQVRLHALDSMCVQLTATGRHEQAIRAGSLAVAAEPLRERARRNLIEAHLAAGNVSEAVHQYEAFVDTCTKVGLAPGAELSAFFPPSPAWPVLHVRRPINAGGAVVGRGLRMDVPTRRSTVGTGAAART